jgi:hypothetical protein
MAPSSAVNSCIMLLLSYPLSFGNAIAGGRPSA